MRYLSIIFAGIILLLLTSSKPNSGSSEKNTPQFHLTSEMKQPNTPNGLVFYNDKYHIFYQYLPDNGNDILQWQHAISEDLINWERHPVTFNSNDRENCKILSGSVVIDEKNTLAKQTGNEKTLIMFYAGQNCGLRIAYSTNEGATWENFEENPVIPYKESDDARDPKVFWHEPTQKWIMVLSRNINDDENSTGASIYSSSNLTNWDFKSHVHGFNESPDLISIKVANRPEETKWILFNGDGSYIIGDFDGETFSPETEKQGGNNSENYFATQTWNSISTENKRVIQVAWLKGGDYSDMTLNGQMTFPTEINITKSNTGYILTRLPVNEIALLHNKHYSFTNKNILPGLNDNPIKKIKGTCFHIVAELDVKTSNNFGFALRYGKKEFGTEIVYNVVRETLSVLGTTVSVPLIDNKVSIEILIDHTSIEIFANGGQVAITHNIAPVEDGKKYILVTNGGELLIKQMDIYSIKTD